MNTDQKMVKSLTIFIVSFFILLIYYISKKPNYVYDKNDKTYISFRLVLIYSLLFSSALSLIIISLDILYHYYLK